MMISLTDVMFAMMHGLFFILLIEIVLMSLIDVCKIPKINIISVIILILSVTSYFSILLFDVELYAPRNNIIFLIPIITGCAAIMFSFVLLIILIKIIIIKRKICNFNLLKFFISAIIVFGVFIILGQVSVSSKLIETLMWSDFFFAYEFIYLNFFVSLCICVSITGLINMLYEKITHRQD